jgi:predicted HD superfamily hydrolase involved in NAD metabolism
MYTAACLAMAHGYSIHKAMLAGLLHDCAKCLSHEERVALCNRHHVEITLSEMKNKALLHAKAGAILARKLYNIDDFDILHAICVHTTGEPNMNLLDKIIYVADYIEPGRDKAPNLEFLRRIAYQNIDQCVACISYDTLTYLNTQKGDIDPATQLTYEFYRQYKED